MYTSAKTPMKVNQQGPPPSEENPGQPASLLPKSAQKKSKALQKLSDTPKSSKKQTSISFKPSSEAITPKSDAKSAGKDKEPSREAAKLYQIEQIFLKKAAEEEK